jgi:choline dehydrogenase-like flavoprotein
VTFKDSQYFLFPALSFSRSANVTQEALHTLCQLFVEINDQDISRYTIHLQVYTYNQMLRALLHAKLGAFGRLVPDEFVLGRLLLFQGYLHSAHSGGIAAELRRVGSGDELVLTAVRNSETKPMIKQVLRKLGRLATTTGAVPVPPMLEITEPGRGFHTGGSLPMADRPAPGQTDVLGRPFGLRRTHAVDSSTFPTIPATTITFTAMANAYRIGEAVARGGAEG